MGAADLVLRAQRPHDPRILACHYSPHSLVIGNNVSSKHVAFRSRH